MQLVSFRIKNFRSIVDTGWVRFSPDNITALVGQNESGKTAILEALAVTFSQDQIGADDFRHGDPDPEIWVKTRHLSSEIDEALSKMTDERVAALMRRELGEGDVEALWHFPSTKYDDGDVTTAYHLTKPDFSNIKDALEQQLVVEAPAAVPVESTPPPPAQSALPTQTTPKSTTTEAPQETPAQMAEKLLESVFTEFEKNLYTTTPTVVLFQEDSGLLPDRIDVIDFGLKGAGSTAALNFLAVAEIDLRVLVASDTRSRAAILRKANQKVTEEFLAFWTQTIGKKSSLELECSIHHYPAEHEKVGKTYLEFLISDGATPLYPKQRSRGTRWFISFFLQLQATALRGRKRVFLLDEPGANLHEKAQSDVLSLLDKISTTIPVIYSTHSPHLISYDRIHRILAVERDPDTPGHPTRIIDSHSLGAASIDTLSPILSTMGVALSRQTAIKQSNNVLLEELSAYYYLRAFWMLTGSTQEAHFLAATGASNLPQLANLFLGWGLDFVVVVDDESSGRAVYKALKRDLFLDREDWAKSRMLRIPDCEGIEDIFEPDDYKKHVLSKVELQISTTNAKWAKTNGAAKAIHALGFLRSVEAGVVTLDALHPTTADRIRNLVKEISERLSNYARNPE